MVREDSLHQAGSSSPTGREPVRLTLITQGGGSRGGATGGFFRGLLENPSITFDRLCGTSAGAMTNAVAAHGLAMESIAPKHHGRQDTIGLIEKLYDIIPQYSPYGVMQSMTNRAQQTLSEGQSLLFHAPFASMMPIQYMKIMADMGDNIQRQFKDLGDALCRGAPLQCGAHVLKLIVQEVIGHTGAINSPQAPLLVNNAVRAADDKHLLFHNRGDAHSKMTTEHIIASAALTAYLPHVHVPKHGPCRDGAQGGANPPLLDFLHLADEIAPRPSTKNGSKEIIILYKLSNPSESMPDELKARDPKLYDHFRQVTEQLEKECNALTRRNDVRLLVVDAALTPELRRQSLANTDPDRMTKLGQIGYEQGKALAGQLLREAGHPHRPEPTRYEGPVRPSQRHAAQNLVAHH